MKEPKKSKSVNDAPDYVSDLQAMYGAPSEEGFGSAVFFEVMDEDGDLEELAKKYYEHFVGHLWEEWGEDAWMGPWKEVYVREVDTAHDTEKELKGIEDRSVKQSIPMILEYIENADEAVKALAVAYDAPEVADFRVYAIGDGEAMSGVILAGKRENGEAVFLVFLMD